LAGMVSGRDRAASGPGGPPLQEEKRWRLNLLYP
jgi:hypothetical protein